MEQRSDVIPPGRAKKEGAMKRCMFVDDSSVIRKVAKRILGSPEMVVVEAGSALEALDMCRAEMPDIIVVDSMLPDMSAVEFIQHVLAMTGQVKPQIMLCLTELDIGAIMRAKRAGAQGYLLKPFNRAQLLERFRQLQAA
jgi:two-component system, chemotaxis family, chemotaxis protein CheY